MTAPAQLDTYTATVRREDINALDGADEFQRLNTARFDCDSRFMGALRAHQMSLDVPHVIILFPWRYYTEGDAFGTPEGVHDVWVRRACMLPESNISMMNTPPPSNSRPL